MEGHAPDDVYEEARREFSDEDLIALSIAIGAINLRNRMAIAFRNEHPKDRSPTACPQGRPSARDLVGVPVPLAGMTIIVWGGWQA